jgi:hypothetical protein
MQPKSPAAWEIHNHSHLFKSAFLPGQPGVGVLLGYRLLMFAVFLFGILFQGVSDEDKYKPKFLIYFTNWTWLLFGIYSFVAILESVRGLRHVFTQAGYTRPFDFLDKLFSFLIATVPSTSLFLSAFYWAALYEKGDDVSPWTLINTIVVLCMCGSREDMPKHLRYFNRAM